jgi:integrase
MCQSPTCRSRDGSRTGVSAQPAAPSKWNRGGGFRSSSCLDKPFAEVGKAIGLPYEVSPRAMRRTYQELARVANVSDIVTRSISGHATPEMQRHYSTVSGDEMRAGLGKVIDIATGRPRAA